MWHKTAPKTEAMSIMKICTQENSPYTESPEFESVQDFLNKLL
jgi:hypothetical protein